MEVQRQQPLARHGIQVAGQRIDHDDATPLFFDFSADEMRELSWRQLRGVHLAQGEFACVHHFLHVESQPGGALDKRSDALIEEKDAGMLAPLGRRARVLRGERGLPRPRRSEEERARAAGEPAAQQLVQQRQAALDLFARVRGHMLRGHQPRIDLDPARANAAIVKSLADLTAAHLEHLQPAAICPVLGGVTIERDDAGRDAGYRQLGVLRAGIVHHHDRALGAVEEVFQGEDLPPIAQRRLGQEPQLTNGIEHDA